MRSEIPADVEVHVDWARYLKGDVVSDRKAGQNDDLAPVLDFRRDPDDETVALVFCVNVDRDEALQAASVGVPGWEADHLICLLDAHQSDERFLEHYGHTPDPFELQDLCDNEGACELGLITDAIMILEAWRSGRLRMTNVPYHVHKTARTVHWIEDDRFACFDTEEHKDGGLAGIVPEALRHFFTIPTLGERVELDPAQFGLDPDGPQAQIHKDLAVMTVLAGAGFGVGFNAKTPLHQELLGNTLKNSHGLAVHDADGTVRRSEGDVDALAILNEALRRKLADERKRQHAEELAERDRRRAARAAGEAPRSLQNIFDDLTSRGRSQ